MTKDKEIEKYMMLFGLPYELEAAGNVFGAIATAGSQYVVMAQTYHEATDAGNQYFCGYYGDAEEAEKARQAILNATPRKRFVQTIIVVGGNS